MKSKEFGTTAALVRTGELKRTILGQVGNGGKLTKTQHGAKWRASFSGHPSVTGAQEAAIKRKERGEKTTRNDTRKRIGKAPLGPSKFRDEMEAIDAPETNEMVKYWEQLVMAGLQDPKNHYQRKRRR